MTLFFIGCSEQPNNPQFFTKDNPQTLSKWGILNIVDGELRPHNTSTVYTLKTALFSDYAHKLRTVWSSEQSFEQINSGGKLEFPVGTVISKTFYYPLDHSSSIQLIEQHEKQNSIKLKTHRLIETRLLVKRESGWVGLPYVWNDEQTEATLQRFGEVFELSGIDKTNKTHSFNYLVPDVNQCAACHQWDMDQGMQPIGMQTRHIHRTNIVNKPVTLEIIHDLKTREYLDINCSHCHNPKGPANTSGLHLESFRELSTEVGLCKLPIAAGKGTGGRNFDIDPGHAENSIFTYRIESTDPASMMPELGRSLVHEEGLELVSSWIAGLDYSCINTDSKLE